MTDEEIDGLIEDAFAGPGRIECVSLCVAGYDAAAVAGLDRAAFVPIPSERRIRIYAGNFNLLSPWKQHLVFTIPRNHAAMELLLGLGAEEEPGPKLFSDLAVVHVPRQAIVPHLGLLLTGVSAAATDLAAASRCPRRNDPSLERRMRELAAPLL